MEKLDVGHYWGLKGLTIQMPLLEDKVSTSNQKIFVLAYRESDVNDTSKTVLKLVCLSQSPAKVKSHPMHYKTSLNYHKQG